MLRILRAAGRPLIPVLVLSLVGAPLVAQQPVQSAAPPAAPAPAGPAPATPAPQPSPLFAQSDDHAATIGAAKEENAKAMSNHTVTMSTTVLILVIVILVLLIA